AKGAIAWLVCASFVALGLALRRRLPHETIARHRCPLAILLAIAGSWTLLTIARPALHAADGLVAEYFSNSEWSGPPGVSVVDTRPSTAGMAQRFGGAVPPDRFSVRWTGYLTVPRSGIYTVALSSDDGSDLTIDGHVAVDNGGKHSLATRSVDMHLARGAHPVVVRYVQFGAESALD